MLKKCEFDKTRLEVMYPKRYTLKKHVQTIHVHHTTHTHTPKSQHIQTHYARQTTHTKHVHTPHSHYGRVYSCTYCGRKDHLAKFCFDRINASNDHIWV